MRILLSCAGYLASCHYKLRIIRSRRTDTAARAHGMCVLPVLLSASSSLSLFRLFNAFSGINTYDKVVFIFINIQDILELLSQSKALQVQIRGMSLLSCQNINHFNYF